MQECERNTFFVVVVAVVALCVVVIVDILPSHHIRKCVAFSSPMAISIHHTLFITQFN